MDLRGLGYIGFWAQDPKAWLAFATDVIGMSPSRKGLDETGGGGPIGSPTLQPDGSAHLKMDARQWRVAVHPGDDAGIAYLGFEVADELALEAACAELTEHGVAFEVGSADDAVARSVSGVVSLSDPAGNRIELFHGLVTDFDFCSPQGAEFVTDPYGLGHTLFMVPDIVPNLDFYRRVLGFRRSDFLDAGPAMAAHFLRCTPRHHSVALAHVGPVSRIHHVMFEMTSIDLVGRALDRAVAAGLDITSSLGRHPNDGMLSFYMRSPAGFEVEIGCDGTLVDEATWCERGFSQGGGWGHHGVSPESLRESVAS